MLMVALGLIAFAMNWALAWTMVRGNRGSIPIIVMMASVSGLTFAFGIVMALALVQFGYSQALAVQESMDVAVYFGLPAGAWASICARHQNKQDMMNARR